MTRDPLAGSSWSAAETVAGFSQSAPNQTLMRFAATELSRNPRGLAVDIGCGAARNTVPLAAMGWRVIGTDLSLPMLVAAVARARREGVAERVQVALAPMELLPLGDRTADLIVAHGIWNLASSGAQFRTAVAEAGRVARPGAALFVFTFSRNTLSPAVAPQPGESFVFTEFAGRPQCFLTDDQLLAELDAAGFTRDPAVPLTEHNRPKPGEPLSRGGPVIYEASFRFRSA